MLRSAWWREINKTKGKEHLWHFQCKSDDVDSVTVNVEDTWHTTIFTAESLDRAEQNKFTLNESEGRIFSRDNYLINMHGWFADVLQTRRQPNEYFSNVNHYEEHNPFITMQNQQ